MSVDIWMMIVVAFAATLATVRKPRFEVPDERRNGANLHWFSLVLNGEAEVRVRQIYFGVGQQFIDAGWNIPNNCFDRLICLVISESEMVTTNAKGEQTWAMCLITQGPVGDLYRECLKSLESKKMKWVEDGDLIVPPNLTIEMSEFDGLTANGSHSPRFVIRHEAHPSNPSRSMYRMTDFNC